MYSKEAMERYEELLNKCEPEIKFTKTAASKIDVVKDILKKIVPSVDDLVARKMDKIRVEFPHDIPSSSHITGYMDDLAKEIAAKMEGVAPELASSLSHPVTPYIAGVGIPAAGLAGLGIGQQMGKAKDDWDKLKYGLSGVAAGLAAPVLYKSLTGGKDLSALAARLGGQEPLPEYADFTSI